VLAHRVDFGHANKNHRHSRNDYPTRQAVTILTVWLVILLVILGALPPNVLMAQEQHGVTEVTPNVLVFATSSGNVAASVGPDGALLVGTPSAASAGFINSEITKRTKSPARYVVIYPQSVTQSEGDGGWTRLGAFVAMHENALRRLGGNAMGAPGPSSERFAKLGVERPRIAFSEVLAFDVNGDSIHVVHQKPGYSDADALTHFHVASVFYLGEVFPGDGYPLIDADQGGTLEGLLSQLVWTDSKQQIVPARGKVRSGTELKEFRDMIDAVRERIQHMLDQGQTESQVLAAHPTAVFDDRWGHGRVSPEVFVREIYRSLKK
jgi:cyclase